MPTYVYKCDNSGFTYEINFPMGTAPDTVECGCGSPMRRVFLPTAVSFKGSGFYKTDHPKTSKVSTRVKV